MNFSAEPKGNSIKYAKQRPREFVSFEYSEVALENIKSACKFHYRENLAMRDILTSEQGTSCSWLYLVQKLKFIYVRFTMPEFGNSILSETLESDLFQSQIHHKKMRKTVISHTTVSPERSSNL